MAMAVTISDAWANVPHVSLGDILLPDDIVYVVAAKLHRAAVFREHHVALPNIPAPKDFRWIRDHKAMFEKHGLAWKQPIHSVNSKCFCGYEPCQWEEFANGDYAFMSDRMKHMLYFFDHAYPITTNDDIYIYDFFQSVHG